jgi:hypothetical protein
MQETEVPRIVEALNVTSGIARATLTVDRERLALAGEIKVQAALHSKMQPTQRVINHISPIAAHALTPKSIASNRSTSKRMSCESKWPYRSIVVEIDSWPICSFSRSSRPPAFM